MEKEIKKIDYKTLIANVYKEGSIPILNRVCVKDGKATSTDLDNFVTIPTNLEDGAYYYEGFHCGLYVKDKSVDLKNNFIQLPHLEPEGAQSIIMDRGALNALDWISKAASKEETRYYLNGVCFDGKMLVATNGHYLFGVELDAEVKDRIIMHNKTIKLIQSLVKEFRANCAEVTFYHRYIKISVAGAEILAKNIDGTFPYWGRVVPENSQKCDIDISEFRNIYPQIKALSKINGQKDPAIKIENGKISVSHDHTGSGIDWNTTLPLKVGFNAKYLCEMCSGTLEYDPSPDKPILIRGNEYKGQIAVLMPLRVF